MNIDSSREESRPSEIGVYKDQEKKKEGTKVDRDAAFAAGTEESVRAALEKAQEGLPKDLKYPAVFKNEHSLLRKLDQLGVSDLQVVLNNDGYAVFRDMPTEEHRYSVRMLERLFTKWVQDRQDSGLKPQDFVGEKEASVFLNDSVAKKAKRYPDFSIFYGPRLDEDGDPRAVKSLEKLMNPQVIFQFSWGNEEGYEKDAATDMMLFGGVGEFEQLKRPNVTYLIKARRRGKESDSLVYGFDVYEVRQNEETPAEPTIKYRVGTQEDSEIVVTPLDIGLTDSTEVEPLVIPMHRFRQQLEKLGRKFVRADPDRNE